MASYYSDLSAASSSSEDEEQYHDVEGFDHADENYEDNVCNTTTNINQQHQNQNSDLWSRCILHLDIDCFYCQCEEIDRGLRPEPQHSLQHPLLPQSPPSPQPQRYPSCPPLAIGQKHIIVTSNYPARAHGVKKLQLRETALKSCPNLWIVEGSDLKNYKLYSRRVYEAFRGVLAEIAKEYGVSANGACAGYGGVGAGVNGDPGIPARKGCMDEMMADLTAVVDRMMANEERGVRSGPTNRATENETNPSNERHSRINQSIYIFGESSTPTELREDQTGQTTHVTCNKLHNIRSIASRLPPSRRNIHEMNGSNAPNDQQLRQSRQEICKRRLHHAAQLTLQICKSIFKTTQFYTTGGISTSPLLAKLSSDIEKPNAINVLYPWRSGDLMYGMPLRKIQSVGRGVMKSLEGAMEVQGVQTVQSLNDNDKKKDVRTVLDLLRTPRESIEASLEGLQSFQGSSSEQCNLLLQKCQGIDDTPIIDDEGGLPKTVSVENSFQRNTICSMPAVFSALDDLLTRLPLLVNDRTLWARVPERAFPTTIRVTVRMVDKNLQSGGMKRRPFVTRSKQMSMMNGKSFIEEKDSTKQSIMLRGLVVPLVNQLLGGVVRNKEVNVTRLNVAVTNFQDVATRTGSNTATTKAITSISTTCPMTSLSVVANSPRQSNLFSNTTTVQKQSGINVGCQLTPSKKIRVGNAPVHVSSKQSMSQKSPPSRSYLSKQGGKKKTTRIDNFFRPKER